MSSFWTTNHHRRRYVAPHATTSDGMHAVFDRASGRTVDVKATRGEALAACRALNESSPVMASDRIEKDRLARVLAYLRSGPRCAREVARDVLGGTGRVRTSERTTATRLLRKLEKSGKVRRVELDQGEKWPAVYYEAPA